MTTTLVLILAIACVLLFPLMEWLEMRQFNKEREEWQKERAKLLDRIQGHGRDEDVEDQVLTEVDNPGQDEGRCHEPGLILALGCRGVTCNASLTVLAVNVA